MSASDADLPFPLSGSTLLTGPSNAGKTRLTYRALTEWVEREGGEDGAGAVGVVVLEFAPELERDGRILGGRLDRFGPLPEDAWVGVLDAHAPRAEGATDEETVTLARENAEGAARILESAPDGPRAVFVNDATIALQHEAGDVGRLTAYCERAECAVLNAFESDELGTDDPVSRREHEALAALHDWADRSIVLEPGD